MNRVTAALCFVLLVLAALGLLFLLVLSAILMRDGVNASLLQFQATPREGWAYWEAKTWREAYRSAVIPGIIWVVLFGSVLGLLFPVSRRLAARTKA